MKLLIIIGNTSVGKMTVGQALTKITPFRLFHNHMSIEMVLEVFGSFHGKAIDRIRDVVFEEFSVSDQYGLIFTYMWDFDTKEDWDYIEHIKEIFDLPEEEVYYVELLAPQFVRLARNGTENRLKHKASKRDISISNSRLLHDDQMHRCESFPGEITFPNYLRLNTETLSAEETADKIKNHFHF